MITVTVILFASAKDIAGTSDLKLSLENGAHAGAVIDTLAAMFPRFAEWKTSLRIAVNQEYVGSDRRLSHNDEIAIISPVSGG